MNAYDWSWLSDLIEQIETHCARLRLYQPHCRPGTPIQQTIGTEGLIETCEVLVEEVRRLGLVRPPVVKRASGPIEGPKQT
jgi:hypothetical protein